MTDDEKFVFTGTLFKAASDLRIFGRLQEDYFVWFDPMANMTKWKTPPGTDKKDILFKAAQSLQNYLNCAA
jgi:hypothetical protein